MIDLIIPYYNNGKGLSETLKSINYDVFNVIVIDDGSDVPLLPPFNAKFQYWRRNINRGPGITRQYGIDHTTNPYIMFIDTGDIFISKNLQNDIVNTINSDPETNVFVWQYYHYDELSKTTDNRMHGKVYKRNFIQNYSISFCPESSYMDEDIGFNRTVRIISDAINIPIKFIETPIIKQTKEETSLTQRNNQESLYKDQTRALSLVTIHTVDICHKNNINSQEEINQIAIALYYWFVRTAAERSEFLPDAWHGAKIFYKKFKKDIQTNELIVGNAYMKRCIQYRKQIRFPINVLRFVDDILKNENLPDKYLT